MTLNNKRYKDLDASFSRHPVTKDVVRVFDDNAVKQSIKNLIRTQMYDAPMQPTKGSKVRGSLFEPVSPITASALRAQIEELILEYEPRVYDLVVDVRLTSTDDEYRVGISFGIKNLPNPVTLTLILNRLR